MAHDSIDALAQDLFVLGHQHSSPQIRDWPDRGLLWEQPDLAVPQSPRVKLLQSLIKLDFLEQLDLELGHGWLRNGSPNIVPVKEYPVSMGIRLRDIEVAPDQGYYYRIKNVVEKLVQNFASLAEISQATFAGFRPARL
jgi:hypothetical protein